MVGTNISMRPMTKAAMSAPTIEISMPGVTNWAMYMTMADVKNPTTPRPYGEMPSPSSASMIPSDSYDHGSDESADKAQAAKAGSHPADHHEDESRDH